MTRRYLKYEIDHLFRNLDELDIENLKAGRITKEALFEAQQRSGKDAPRAILAEELNEMLAAGMYVREQEMAEAQRMARVMP